MHRAAMKTYYDMMKKNGVDIHYCDFNEKPKSEYLKEYLMFHPVDKLKLPGKHNFLESPNFLLTLQNFEQFREKSDKFFFNSFYMWGKGVVDIIPNVKSQDKVNRKRMPDNVEIPKLPTNKSKNDTKYIEEAVKYVEKHFPKNYGTSDNFQPLYLIVSRNG